MRVKLLGSPTNKTIVSPWLCVFGKKAVDKHAQLAEQNRTHIWRFPRKLQTTKYPNVFLLHLGRARTDMLVKSWQKGVSHNMGRFTRDILLFLSFVQSWHFSNVMPRASEGDRIWWRNASVATEPICCDSTNVLVGLKVGPQNWGV